MTPELSRRRLLELGAGLGVGAMLTACGSSGNKSGAGSASSGAGSSSAPSASSASSVAPTTQAGGKIVAGEWGGVWDQALQQVCPPFTAKTGIKVTNSVTTGGQLAVLQQNPGKYDLSWLIGSDAANGYKAGTLDAIDQSKVPNIGNIIPQLTQGQMVDGNLTGVPISYGAEGILWRTDKVPFKITSWKDLWRPELKGQIALQNAPSIGGLMLVYAAARAFGSGPDDYDAGFAAIEKLKDNVQYLYTISSDPINKLASGAVAVVVTLADQGIPLKDQHVEVTIPAEGSTWSLQNITIPTASKNKDLVYEFINYMLQDDSQAMWSKYAKIAPASTTVNLGAAQQNIVETPAVAKTLWPINWLELGADIPSWTTRWQKIFT